MSTITHTHHHNSHHHSLIPREKAGFDLLFPLRRWVDRVQVGNRKFAHLICQIIPCCCPFERDINLFGKTHHIPPLCKLNPLYDEFVGLRFRALNYLADVCQEDITIYIC
ncbi:MAG TPA: nitrogenase [Cyanobacteria bacterium UBA11149]|nr:nitrogenase [Cyanobacteria bacterium UBA11367]HBE58645.1 nitrogenase [Cyanobacteria bacterium UBA11366]HBK66696.1 nitrogenase [Cyanobacteria bacterium UBA11166]HBR73953.1 nitrogenase [Cyanobacteria bacterium UBA11159]HBS69615.1 nitrogenase [Cyanobacteria bacterium UBA11153]HBW88504.1 nitrogenase [Cyanobacteria bacterium UBA11149]HCA96410.1 nitrogenase [Cyanobacteria bacterium UBA9226]